MKVYLCVESDYDGSTTFRIFKDKKKAEKLVSQVKRLFDVYHKAFEIDRKIMEEYMVSRPEIINNTKFDMYYNSEEYKKLDKFRRKVDVLVNELGADTFYSQCSVEEMKIE